jgi:hypothetical protein
MCREVREQGLSPQAAATVETMPRLPRSRLPDGYFHATARAVFGAALFIDDFDRLDFLKLLRSTAALFDWRCRRTA